MRCLGEKRKRRRRVVDQLIRRRVQDKVSGREKEEKGRGAINIGRQTTFECRPFDGGKWRRS